MAHVLQFGCTIACPHQGQASVPAPSNSSTKVDGKFALLVSDVFVVAGCTFVSGSTPNPCLTLRWSGPATKVKVKGTAVLLETSVAECLNAAQAPQGVAQISGVQTKVSGI
ncbi:MAG TPA: hypothetical protein VE974_28440 [Thermoanaerobaculia bacterium]|nr:hypothetical protein [Thermoanaerobaculia bacterium]